MLSVLEGNAQSDFVTHNFRGKLELGNVDRVDLVFTQVERERNIASVESTRVVARFQLGRCVKRVQNVVTQNYRGFYTDSPKVAKLALNDPTSQLSVVFFIQKDRAPVVLFWVGYLL